MVRRGRCDRLARATWPFTHAYQQEMSAADVKNTWLAVGKEPKNAE